MKRGRLMINLTNNGADGARWTVDVYGIMHGRHVEAKENNSDWRLGQQLIVSKLLVFLIQSLVI